MVNHLKALYNDAVAILIILIFALGVGHIAQRAVAFISFWREIGECIGMAVILALPLTLFRLFTNTKPVAAKYVDEGLTTTLLAAILLTYIILVCMNQSLGMEF